MAISGNEGIGKQDVLITDGRRKYKVDEKAKEIGYHGSEKHELGEFSRTPCSLKISSSEENGHAGDDQAENILLNEGRSDEHPRIHVRVFWIYDEIRRADDGAVSHHNCLCREGGILPVTKHAFEKGE